MVLIHPSWKRNPDQRSARRRAMRSEARIPPSSIGIWIGAARGLVSPSKTGETWFLMAAGLAACMPRWQHTTGTRSLGRHEVMSLECESVLAAPAAAMWLRTCQQQAAEGRPPSPNAELGELLGRRIRPYLHGKVNFQVDATWIGTSKRPMTCTDVAVCCRVLLQPSNLILENTSQVIVRVRKSLRSERSGDARAVTSDGMVCASGCYTWALGCLRNTQAGVGYQVESRRSGGLKNGR